MQLEVKCIECKKVYKVTVPDEGFYRWVGGEKIQHALPSLSADDRELLMSHMCGKCFDKLFAEEFDNE